MPLPFYLVCLLLLVAGLMAWRGREEGWGVPMGAVLATMAVWYVGDAYYNDYGAYLERFGDATLTAAWWQVLLFLLAFMIAVPAWHRAWNGRFAGRRSEVLALVHYGSGHRPDLQDRLDRSAVALFFAWALLAVIALIRVKGDVLGLFAPYLGHKVNPWGRGQIGGGFSALISLAGYFQMFLTAACGVVAALSNHPRIRGVAIVICVLALPWYVFDRTRHLLVVVLLPGLIAWVMVRLRTGWLGRLAVLGAAFLALNLWFSVVMENRSGMRFDIAGALETLSGEKEAKARHEGLNMFEELCWIETLTRSGAYAPNWGRRYFAELVNPIPRGLWKNKPTIGLDYAVARGQRALGPQGQVTATISTGMIGQGVVNFGPFYGPIAAAALMGLWVAVLARQDLLGTDPSRLLLYGVGITLTFNLGRDITLLVLYPFLFGLLAFHLWRRLGSSKDSGRGSVPPRHAVPAPPR